MKLSCVCSHFLLLLSVLILFSSVWAIPSIPHQFNGTVTINGSSAPDGTDVSAVIGADTYSTSTVNGVFGTEPAVSFFVEDPNGTREGQTIEFFVNGKSTGITAIFEMGNLTELSLAITQDSGDPGNPGSPGNLGGGGSGGGGGGGGGGSGTINVTIVGNCINEDILIETLYSNGNPNRGVSLKVLDDSGVVVIGTTNLDGEFVLNLSEPGEYQLEAIKSGFSKKELAFTIIDCTLPETTGETENNDIQGTTNTVNTNNELPDNTEQSVFNEDSAQTPITGFFGVSGNAGNALFAILLIVGLGAIYIGWQRKNKK